MHIVPVLALVISLSATAAIAPSGSSRSAPMITAPLGGMVGSALGGAAPSKASSAVFEVSARGWKLVRKRPSARKSLNRRRVLASRGRYMPTGPRTERPLRRSEGPSPNLPPNLGVGIGTGF
jgi:hypothetical protein